MYVGVGASRVRDLFAKARAVAPCIVFMDEIDAIGRHRGGGIGNSHDEREQTLNQILKEMDGFEGNSGIIVLAATNRPDILDSALTRAGRFDRHVNVPNPDINGRAAIFRVHTRKLALQEGIDLLRLARKMPMMSGADIEHVCNEASLRAAKNNRKEVIEADFDAAIEKVQLGAERRGVSIRLRDLQLIAYHEAGHAITGHFTPECDPIDKVTIVPRGRALGLTHFLPEDDKHIVTREELVGMIVSLLGGRAAEILIGRPSTGAQNDLERATGIARQMVCQFAMGSMPIRTYGPSAAQTPWSHVETERDYGEETSRLIDADVAKITKECWDKAQMLVKREAARLEALAKTLLEKETVGADVLTEILGPRPTKA
jgi:cell division protease FtsH